MAYNFGHDVALPGSSGPPVAFFMHPQAETAEGRLDSLDPDSFRYEITSKEITQESVVGCLHGRPVPKAFSEQLGRWM